MHLDSVADSPDLWRIRAYVAGTLVEQHTVTRAEIGPLLLSALSQSLADAQITTSAVQGAQAWGANLPVPTKQEAGQLARFAAALWRWVRVFLP